ncbi:MAG: hypothetical protein ACRD0U_11765 [Acidimicrobiales bacterium]
MAKNAMRATAAGAAVVLLLGLGVFPARALDPIGLLLPQGLPAPVLKLPVEGLTSPNVEYLGTIPIDAPGVGARLRTEPSGRKLLYVSGVLGLSIYDVTRPATPMLLGHLVLPNWENEDISVSDDGHWALISAYTAEIYLHVIDVSVPSLPLLVGTKLFEGGAHTVDCIDAACNVVYGSDGQMINLSNKANPIVLPTNWMRLAEEQIRARTGNPGFELRGGHALNVDAAGIVTTDTTPLVMLDVTDPFHPQVITTSDAAQMDAAATAYQHNNLRPGAAAYQPRVTEAERADPNLRPGELVLSNGETNLTGRCGPGNGPFATYGARGFDEGQPLQLLDVFRPVTGDYSNGDPSFNVLGCSGHWFTDTPDGDDHLVAAGWYEHGTRFLRVDGQTGAISQVGYFQPVLGSASAAYWIDDEHVYTVDYLRGVDILRFRRDGAGPSAAQVEASWLSKLGLVHPLAEAQRQFCALFT